MHWIGFKDPSDEEAIPFFNVNKGHEIAYECIKDYILDRSDD
jgi:hypothetical protein